MATLQDYAGDDLDKLRQQMAAGGAAPAAPDAAPAPSPAAAALANPAFADFVSQRAKELQAAQDQANKNQRMADLANAGVKVSAALEGKDAPKELLDANMQRAQLPVAQALQRQAGAEAATKDFGAQQDITTKGNTAAWEQAKRDPNSPVSKTIQRIYRPVLGPAADYLTAADAEVATAGGQLQISKIAETARAKQAQAQIAHQNAQLALESRKADEETRHHKVEEIYMGQKPLSESTTNELDSLPSAINALQELKEQKGGSGFVDKVLSKFNLGDYDQTKTAVAAEVAKADAGGKVRPTAAAAEKNMLPGAFQDNKLIDTKQQQLLQTFENKIREHQASGRVSPAQLAVYQQQLGELKTKIGNGAAAPHRVASDADFDALPSGAQFVGPDGKLRRKP